jgi:hypothetical protein
VLDPDDESLELDESLEPELELEELELELLDELESLDELLLLLAVGAGSGTRGAVTLSPSHAADRPTAPTAPASSSRKVRRSFSSPSLSLAIKASCCVRCSDIR